MSNRSPTGHGLKTKGIARKDLLDGFRNLAEQAEFAGSVRAAGVGFDMTRYLEGVDLRLFVAPDPFDWLGTLERWCAFRTWKRQPSLPIVQILQWRVPRRVPPVCRPRRILLVSLSRSQGSR